VGTRRLTRKEIIQEDKIQSLLRRTTQWFTTNIRLLAIATGVVVVVVTAAYLWVHFSRATSVRLQAQFAEALAIHSAPVGQEQTAEAPSSKYSFKTEEERHKKALAEFTQIAEDSPKTVVGQFARYYVGLNQHQLGQVAEARKTMEELIDEANEPMVRSLAANYLAQMSEAEKNNQQAIEMLNKALENAAPGFPKSSFLFRLGQNYEALGKTQDAVKQYQRILTEFPDSAESEQARARIDALPKETAKK